LGGYSITYDRDRDYVPDSIEPLYGFDPRRTDTDGDGWKDWEDRGYDAECPWVESSADNEDWANPGHQYH